MRVRGLGSAIEIGELLLKYSELVNTWFAWWTFSVLNFCGIIFVRETKKKTLTFDVFHNNNIF